MANDLTRRGLVAAAPAALIAAGLPALAHASNPDAALLAMRGPYERTLAAAESVSPAHTRAEEAVGAIMRAHPDRDRGEVEREVGLDVAEACWEAALDVNSDVIRQISETPAQTLEGLIFKARICERDCLNTDLAQSIVADLVALGEANA